MSLFHRASTLDPYHNLAVERVLFESIGRSIPDGASLGASRNKVASTSAPSHALLVWIDSPCIVIGRHQNPWTECDLAAMDVAGVPLVRRVSGGGAVYHDTGNLNFSFLGTHESYDLDRHYAVVVRALTSLGISAHRNDRNDIILGDAPEPGTAARGRLPEKISGSAFRHTRNRSLHHGTLLVSADLDRLNSFLRSPAPVTASKGIPSVRSTVANLSRITPGLTVDNVIDALAESYQAEYGSPVVHADQPTTPAAAAPTVDLHIDQDAVSRYEAELRSWKWRYGNTPAFTIRVGVAAAGGVASWDRPADEPSILVTVNRGTITDVVPEQGAKTELEPEADPGTELLIGMRFSAADLESAARQAGGDAARHILAISRAAAGQ